MGKIRIKTFGDEEAEQKQKEKLEKRKEARLQRPEPSDGGQAKITSAKEASKQKQEENPSVMQALEEQVKSEETASEEKKEEKIKEEKTVKKLSSKKETIAFHSQKYQALLDLFDKTKTYTLSEGLDVLEKLQRKKFDETVELHINTINTGISGNVVLPHGTGKKTKVAIATDALIAEIEKGKIDFDILIAEPSQMAKLAKVAKVLGPRGLMPNPKNGTIASNPEEVAKKYEGGQINFKTEAKTPIIHLNVGKMSFGKEKLTQNIEEMLKAVKKSNIVNITLKSTMSPGIKIRI